MRLNPLRLFRKQDETTISRDITTDPAGMQLEMMRLMVRDRQRDRRFRVARFALVALVPTILIAGQWVQSSGPGAALSVGPQLAVIHIDGTVGAGTDRADLVVPALKKAFESDKVKAVALMINSGGGSPIDAERINTAMDSYRLQHPKPVIAVINSLGASAAYLVAMHADEVMAGHYSLVGSIGAVIETWDFSGALQRLEVKQRVYASGALKAMLNPYVASSQAADDKAQALVGTMAQQFLGELRRTRGARLLPGVKYDTGEVWGGDEAKRIGLVDTVGTIEDLQTRLDKKWPGIHPRDFGPGPTAGGWLATEFRQTLAAAIAPSVQ